MGRVIVVMIALIKYVICDEPMDKNIIESITSEVREELYSLSQKHDLAHLVAYALKKANLLGEDVISKKFSKSIYVAVARYANIVAEQEKICDAFERCEIMYVPLKGAVVRNYYPEKWMRTSCDIDILVKSENVERAKEMLLGELGYKLERHNYHDLSFYSESGVHLELHFSIKEDEERVDEILQNVWGHLGVEEGYTYRMRMEPSYFVFHQIAHALHHFVHGGCGARVLIDLWVINKNVLYDKEIFLLYCDSCGISTFAYELNRLVGVWFDKENHSEVTKKMEEYILTGGVYGTKSNLVAANRSRAEKTGRLHYWWKRIFVPYSILASSEENLRKHPILYPYYQVKRWFKIFEADARKAVVQEIKVDQLLDREQINEVKELFNKLKLR